MSVGGGAATGGAADAVLARAPAGARPRSARRVRRLGRRIDTVWASLAVGGAEGLRQRPGRVRRLQRRRRRGAWWRRSTSPVRLVARGVHAGLRVQTATRNRVPESRGR